MFVNSISIPLTFFINMCFDLPIKLFAELADAEQCAYIELKKEIKEVAEELRKTSQERRVKNDDRRSSDK